ncbi:uncharacterized protein LOC106085459 [Stomoxys calcitrans]|uniref:DUF4485 domain-containing protein n=1 Tax=Stomoxys calcitrans TaxID=35570 RepID=A0A1I8Q8S8_STOCA|nr:uncharacterized protein LOC106085459 [Stomoxys calcitrans]
MSEEEKNEIEYLETQFANGLCGFSKIMPNYDFREKYIVNQWITKLKKSNGSIDERRLRNNFIEYFVADTNIFKAEPFNSLPDNFNGSLMVLKKLLPRDPKENITLTDDEKGFYITELFATLPDKGSFLIKQPVPRDGFFFITVFKPNEAIFCEKS